jgi:hypothetical protein
VATTKAIRNKRNRLAIKERQKALSTEERESGRAVFEEEKERSAAIKNSKQQKSEEVRDANYNAAKASPSRKKTKEGRLPRR